MIRICGTFHAVMAPTTPTGSRRTVNAMPEIPARDSSHARPDAIAGNPMSISSGAPT